MSSSNRAGQKARDNPEAITGWFQALICLSRARLGPQDGTQRLLQASSVSLHGPGPAGGCCHSRTTVRLETQWETKTAARSRGWSVAMWPWSGAQQVQRAPRPQGEREGPREAPGLCRPSSLDAAMLPSPGSTTSFPPGAAAPLSSGLRGKVDSATQSRPAVCVRPTSRPPWTPAPLTGGLHSSLVVSLGFCCLGLGT